MSETEQNKEIKKQKKQTIKNLYLKIFIPIFLAIIVFLISNILYAILFPNYIYYIRNQTKISEMHENLLDERLKRIELLNNKIDNIDNDYLENDSINYDKYIELRKLLVNERDLLWTIK